jgi:hypothetical protein
MRNPISIAALAAILAMPLLGVATDADAASCKTRKLNGTLLGAAGGAAAGGLLTHGSTGPIVGGLAGAVVGREVGRNGCYEKRAYRRSAHRPAHYRSSTPRYEQPARKVYYDQYGAPVARD